MYATRVAPWALACAAISAAAGFIISSRDCAIPGSAECVWKTMKSCFGPKFAFHICGHGWYVPRLAAMPLLQLDG